MAYYCSDCTHLNLSKPKKEGVKGMYKCNKNSTREKDKFVYGHQPQCEKFSEAYARRGFDREKIYDDGKELENKYVPSDGDFPGLLVLIFLAILLAIFGLL